MLTIRKGTKCHTITSDPNYYIGATHYFSFLPDDIETYRRHFPWEIRDREGDTPIYDFISIPLKDLKILERNEAKEIFDKLYQKNMPFRLKVGMIFCMFLDAFFYLNRPLTGNELLAYELLSKVRMGDVERTYDAFELTFELDEWVFSEPYQIFFRNLRQKGFDGVADTADILYNIYNVEAPVVTFNPDRMRVIESCVIN